MPETTETTPATIYSPTLEAVRQPGPRFDVTIIRPGISANGLRYSREVLAASLPLWHGASAFCDHPTSLDGTRAGGRSLRDLVGVYSDPHLDHFGAIRATLAFNPAGAWLAGVVEGLIADRAAGRVTPNVGISADMFVLKAPGTPIARADGQQMPTWDVGKVIRVNSADLVINPSAGGSFDRILEAAELANMAVQEDTVPDEITTAAQPVQEARPLPVAGPSLAPTPPPTAPTPLDDVRTGFARITALENELAAVRETRTALAAHALEARLAASTLPEQARTYLRAQFTNPTWQPAQLDRAIESLQQMLGAVFQPQTIAGAGFTRAARVTGDPLSRVQAAMDRLFGLELPDALKDTPRLSGIREAYILITGDRLFDGRYHWEESIVREADEVTTSVMANVVANSMTKRLVQDYKGQSRWWEPVVSQISLSDMKAQDRILLYDFAVLPTVAENGPYVNLAWDDTKETYTPVKKGSAVTVTMEMILNDDVRAVTKIPSKLAIAANITINEYVSNLFTQTGGTGPLMTDQARVFSAGHGSNTSANALSSANLQAAMIVMAKQVNSASKRLGIAPRYLLIPPDLTFTAQILTQSMLTPGGLDNDVNVLRGTVQPIVVPQFTETNHWYIMADPAVVESIEIGFVNGRREPELLVQDAPTEGAVFTNDAITYKVRHMYGGNWLDYRGAYAGLP